MPNNLYVDNIVKLYTTSTLMGISKWTRPIFKDENVEEWRIVGPRFLQEPFILS